MLFDQIKSPGLAHFSYLIGDGAEAVVIDPRRDVDIYLEHARRAGMRITDVLETHRNEDYLIGSRELEQQTGSRIWHADAHLDYQYGQPVEAGQVWGVGRLKLRALPTPGHTPGAFSYLLLDADDNPWMVFTGDALFAGDVGRVDFLGEDRTEEMAGVLYDSLYQEILPLGDGVLVCPAHGAGSACGAEIAERPITSVGLEKRANPRLQHRTREAFVADVANVLPQPPYFAHMESRNLTGKPGLADVPAPRPLSPKAFAEEAGRDDAVVVDVRSELAFASSHVPGSYYLYKSSLEPLAGEFIPVDRRILLIDDAEDPSTIMTRLRRIGFDNIAGFLSGGMLSWNIQAREVAAVATLPVYALCQILDSKRDVHLLDVRKEEELATQGIIQNAQNIPINQIPARLDEIPSGRPIYVFCGSGLRATTVASLLKAAGFTDVTVALGGFGGWTSVTCPIVRS